MQAGIGTHFDSAQHFIPKLKAVDDYTIKDLCGPAVKIDISAACERDPDYGLTKQDVLNWESVHGKIPQGAIVVAETGYWKIWNSNGEKYLGMDAKGVRHFPSFGLEGTQTLLERGIRAIAVDGMSIDVGQDAGFPVHVAVLSKNLWALENVGALDQLPSLGAYLLACPILLKGGSEAPSRVVAFTR